MRLARRQLISIVGSAIAVGSLAIVIWGLAPDWSEVTEIAQAISPMTIIVLLGTILIAEVLFAYLWTRNMRHLGAGVALSEGVGGYFYAGLSRFLPGAVFPYVARTAVVMSRTTTGVQASVAAGVETVLSSIAALGWAVAGLSGRLVPYEILNLKTLTLAVVLLAGFGLVTYLALPRLLRTAKLQVPEGKLGVATTATSLLGYALGWFTMGLGVSVILADAISLSVSPIDATGALALAWFAGFVAVPVPGGLGVREGVMAGVFSGTIGLESGIFVAFTHRIAWTFVIATAGILAMSSRRLWGTPVGSHERKADPQ